MNNKFNKNILQALAATAGISTGVLWYHGFFQYVSLKEQKMGPYNYIYYNRIGRYDQQKKEWQNIAKEMNEIFKSSYPIGIYYDNPSEIKDLNKARQSMGFYVSDYEKSQIKNFLEKYPKYSHTVLPEVKASSTSFPYKSFLSFNIINRKVYPSIYKYFKERKIDPSCIVESYHFDKRDKSINYDVPYGEGSEKYQLI